jgi:hypothetical protein
MFSFSSADIFCSDPGCVGRDEGPQSYSLSFADPTHGHATLMLHSVHGFCSGFPLPGIDSASIFPAIPYADIRISPAGTTA